MLLAVALFLCAFGMRCAQAKPVKPDDGRTWIVQPDLSKANVSASDYVIQCDEQYGVDLDMADCNSALNHMTPTSSRLSFREREDPERSPRDIPLPYRIMGDKGICFIDPTLVLGASYGEATTSEIWKAATELVTKCGFARQKGGTVTNIGGDGNVGLVLGKYKPSIVCKKTLPQWRSCNAVLYHMQADIKDEVFGPPSDPHFQVGLPAEISSDYGACKFTVFTTSPIGIDITSWYKLWEAATALYCVCGRHGKGGFFAGLGDNHYLLASLTGKAVSIGGKTANLTRVLSDSGNTNLSDG